MSEAKSTEPAVLQRFTIEQRNKFDALGENYQSEVIAALQRIEEADDEIEQALNTAAEMRGRLDAIRHQAEDWRAELNRKIPETDELTLHGKASIDDLLVLLEQRHRLADLEGRISNMARLVESKQAQAQTPGNRKTTARRILVQHGLA